MIAIRFSTKDSILFLNHQHRDQKIAAVHTADECPHGEFHSGDQDRVSEQIIFTSERQLRLAVKEYLEYWNHYRPHAGLGGKMVKPYPQDMNAPVREVSFLGGLLHGYRREQAAA